MISTPQAEFVNIAALSRFIVPISTDRHLNAWRLPESKTCPDN